MCALTVAATMTSALTRIADSFRQIKARLKYVTSVFSAGVCAVATSTKVAPVQRPMMRRRRGDIGANVARVRAIETAKQDSAVAGKMAVTKLVRHNKRFNPATNDFDFERPKESQGHIASTSDPASGTNLASNQNSESDPDFLERRSSSILESPWEIDDGVVWKWDGESVILDGSYVRAESPSPPPSDLALSSHQEQSSTPSPIQGKQNMKVSAEIHVAPQGDTRGQAAGSKSELVSTVDKIHTAFQSKFNREDAARQSRFFNATEALHEKLTKEHREKLASTLRREKMMDKIPILSAFRR